MTHLEVQHTHKGCGGRGMKVKDRLAGRHVLKCLKCGKIISRSNFTKGAVHVF